MQGGISLGEKKKWLDGSPPAANRFHAAGGLDDAELGQVAELHVAKRLPGADDRGVCRMEGGGEDGGVINDGSLILITDRLKM